MKTRTAPWKLLRVSRFRRSLIYQPLAAFLAVLLAPSLAWFQGMAGVPLGTSARAFQASAQVILGCGPSQPNSIIQKACPVDQTGNPITTYVADVRQLESDAVNAYVVLHGIPVTDAHLIYDTGREDLRYEVRGIMVDMLKAIVLKPASGRTTHEQQLYNWLQTLVQQNEITEYTQALSNFNSFKTDPCHYTLDPDLANQYGLSFDNTPWCFPLLARGFQPPIPAADYFIAFGMKQSYEKPASAYPYFPGLVAGTALGEKTALNDLTITATAVEIAALVPQLQIGIATAFVAYILADTGIPTATTIAAGPVIGTIASGSIYTGPAGIILTCILAGVVASVELASDQQQLDILNNLSNTLQQETETPPDLSSFINDSVGLLKVRMTFIGQTLPDVPSSAVLPSHRSGTDPQFVISSAGGGSDVKSDTLAYQDTLGAHWSAQTDGGWFVQTCSGGTGPCAQTDSLIADINYVDWSGTSWTASRRGNIFVSIKSSPASTDVPCPADANTGISPTPANGNFSACSSYASKNIPLKDVNGNLVSVSLETPPAAPAFTTPTSLFFTPGLSFTETIAASANPAPNICYISGNLPRDFSLNGGGCGSGSFQLAFNGDPNAPAQTYSLTLQASNGVGTPATQTYNVYVSPQLAITSSAAFLPTLGLPASFLVTTTGVPAPKLSIDRLPPELTFTDNGNGTATVTGTLGSEWPANDFAHSCNVGAAPCIITATNVTGSVSQTFTIFANPNIPPVTLASAPSATFIAGVPNAVQLASAGATNPVSWQLVTQANICSGKPCDINAPWLSLVGATSLGTGISELDSGAETVVLSGTPPVGTSGTYTVLLFVFGWGTAPAPVPIPFTVTVVDLPDFVSPNHAAFTVGTADSFQIQTNGASATSKYIFPQGLSLSPGNPANISGTPAAGTGGVYNPIFMADAGSNGIAQQQFTLTIYEAPQITSANSATFFTGVRGYFAVTTTGFPNLSASAPPPNPLPPTSPTQGEGMFFTVTGLPPDLQFSNLNAQGFATGTLTIQGTPSAGDAGLHQVEITAENGVGQAAQKTLNLNIITITGPAPTSGSTCNGNYNGTFKGNVTVSAGQNCTFIGGAITGNVAVNAGNITLANATVTGNMVIQGSTAFSIGTGSTIAGNLSIQNVASASAMNQICGAKINGNVQVASNATPIQIGSASQYSCPGNFVGGNFAIENNTAVTTVYNNAVEKQLTCSNNTSITGAGNTAQPEQGQCSAF